MRFEIRVFADHLDVVLASSPTEFLQQMFETVTRAKYPMLSTVSIKGSIYVSTWTFPQKTWDQALSEVVRNLRHHGMDFEVVDGTPASPFREPGDA